MSNPEADPALSHMLDQVMPNGSSWLQFCLIIQLMSGYCQIGKDFMALSMKPVAICSGFVWHSKIQTLNRIQVTVSSLQGTRRMILAFLIILPVTGPCRWCYLSKVGQPLNAGFSESLLFIQNSKIYWKLKYFVSHSWILPFMYCCN